MDSTSHALHAELVQQHAQHGLSHPDAAAAATAALGAERAASAAASNELHEAFSDGGKEATAFSDGGKEEAPALVPGAKLRKTEGAGGAHAGGVHAGGGGTATAGAGGPSSTAGGNTVGLPSETVRNVNRIATPHRRHLEHVAAYHDVRMAVYLEEENSAKQLTGTERGVLAEIKSILGGIGGGDVESRLRRDAHVGAADGVRR
jgi:hypothetical protein